MRKVSINFFYTLGFIINLTNDSIGGSPPASKRSMFQFGFSLRRLATTEPADPAPTIMKSYVPKPEKETIQKIIPILNNIFENRW